MWHFTIRGPPDTDFEGGIYHGRISLPPEYPLKPPSIFLLTVRPHQFSLLVASPFCLTQAHPPSCILQPNGRFEVNKRICLSMSDYHPETWQSSWSSAF